MTSFDEIYARLANVAELLRSDVGAQLSGCGDILQMVANQLLNSASQMEEVAGKALAAGESCESAMGSVSSINEGSHSATLEQALAWLGNVKQEIEELAGIAGGLNFGEETNRVTAGIQQVDDLVNQVGSVADRIAEWRVA